MAATELNQTPKQTDPGTGTSAPRAAAEPSREARQHLLGLRVSRIISAHADALDVLISGGFAPLANPVARMAMAHTVTLAQALRIRGLDDPEEQQLIARLLQLDVAWREQ